jgi:hypothetical protein
MDPSRPDKKTEQVALMGDQMFDCEPNQNLASLGGAREKDPRPSTHEAQINGKIAFFQNY